MGSGALKGFLLLCLPVLARSLPDIPRRCRRGWLTEGRKVPGFAVFFQAHFFGLAMRVEAEHGLGRADFDGDDVPDVEGDDPSAPLRTGYGRR